MKNFEHKSAKSFDEAAELIKNVNNSMPLAGGTDLIFELKSEILPVYPERIVNLKNIEDGAYIKKSGKTYKIGALTKLKTLVDNKELATDITALNQAAKSIATILVRNTATIGGNICQDVRCWYYRYPHHQGGRIDCARKDGELCYAVLGDNRYHSIFGGMKTSNTNVARNVLREQIFLVIWLGLEQKIGTGQLKSSCK